MNAKSPFKIEYNQSLENVIKSFLVQETFIWAINGYSEYYFPCLKRLSPKKMYHWDKVLVYCWISIKSEGSF
jgi:membrane-bound lytic murein transglycosylase D